MQIFVKISSASKVENLPFSEKSAELATLVRLACAQFVFAPPGWAVGFRSRLKPCPDGKKARLHPVSPV